MYIDNIKLTNFKGFEDADISFDGKTTVFFGINGAGKSSVLRAVNLLFSNIINKIVSNRFKQGIKIELSDITIGRRYSEILCNLKIGNNIVEYYRTMEKPNKRKHSNSIDDINRIFSEKYLNDDSENMPVFINYGVNRIVIDVPLRIYKKHEFDKLSAFEKAIESKIDFRTFFEWFRNQQDIENDKAREINDFDYEDRSLKSVKKAVKAMTGFDDIRIKRNPLSMQVEKNNKFFNIEQLSDGEKCTLALIGDISRRLSIANSSLENPNEGEGIVLIDEIELHMHPKWQRVVIQTLRGEFPNIQFIITTHSPQVLGEIDSNVNIYQLERDDDDGIELNLIENGLSGWDSNYILEEFMQTSHLNTTTKGIIAHMYELIGEKKYDLAEKQMEKLVNLTNSIHEDAVNARVLINRGKRNLNA